MATIFDLTENTAPDGTDRLYITDGTNDEGVQIANLLKGSGAEVPAAKITGTVLTSNLPTITHEKGGLEADVSAYDGLIRISGGSTSNLKSNFSASAAPTAGDDSGDGYVVGSRWIDTTNDAEYVCVDNTASAAVWVQTAGGGGGGVNGMVTSPFYISTGTNAVAVSSGQAYGGQYGGNGTDYIAVMQLPSDFSSVVNAHIWAMNTDTTEGQITITTHCATTDEAIFNGGAISTTSTSTWFTSDAGYDLEKIDISGLLSSAAAGDLVYVGVQNDASETVYLVAASIEYS